MAGSQLEVLLAVADQGGVIDGPGIRALARKLNLTVEYLEPALEKLMEPAPDSRSEAHEGRRVLKRGRPAGEPRQGAGRIARLVIGGTPE